jgi:capsular polysaccharide export protein
MVSTGNDLHATTIASNHGRWLCVVARRWKRVVMEEYLRGATHLRFCTRLPRSAAAYREVDYLLVWGRQTTIPSELRTAHPHLKIVTAEDGFISSCGLGLTGSFYYSVLLDGLGVHYDATTPSQLQQMLNERPLSAADERLGQELVTFVRDHRLSKCNLSQPTLDPTATPPPHRTTILAVGQVEGDQALRKSLSPIRSNRALLKAIREQHPEAWIIYRPHPNDVRKGYLRGNRAYLWNQLCDQLACDGDISHWMDAVDAVHVMSSTAGLEALIRNKPVHTYGTPCYAGWGLTSDWAKQPGRDRTLNLEQLAAIMLGHYPRYFNWSTGRFCDALSCLRHLQAINSKTIEESFYCSRLASKQRRIRLARRVKMAAVRQIAPIAHWLEKTPQPS